MGIEPTIPAWKAGVLLFYFALSGNIDPMILIWPIAVGRALSI